MKVKCERDGTVFETTPRPYPNEEFQFTGEFCQESGYKDPARVIDCPTCGRGYFQEEDGTWKSDRKLTIIEEEVL